MVFIIDNVVVSRNGNGCKIASIAWYTKRGIDINQYNIRRISTGTRLSDNRIITQLAGGVLTYDNVRSMYVQPIN